MAHAALHHALAGTPRLSRPTTPWRTAEVPGAKIVSCRPPHAAQATPGKHSVERGVQRVMRRGFREYSAV